MNAPMRHVIRDHAGEIIAFHDRYEAPDGSKRFTWSRPDGSVGLGGLAVADLPLFGAQRAGTWTVEKPVLIAEGEKAARALIEAGWQAVGTVTGASSCPSRESLSILVGQAVVIWPDADGAGRSHMTKVAVALGEPGELVASLRLIEWRNAPTGGDAADFLASGGDVAELVAAALPMAVESAPVRAPRRQSTPMPPGTKMPITDFNEHVTVTEVLARDFGVQARPGRAVRCPLHEDRSPSLSILPDDRRVYCHSPSCVLHDDGRGADAWALAHLAAQVPA